MEVALSKEETTGWTISGTNTQTNFWVLTQNAYIESPAVEVSTVESIVVNMRTYGGSSYNTVDITCAGQTLGSLEASSKTLQDYTLLRDEASWTGSGEIRFSSTTNTATYGPGVAAITIRLSGAETVYTEYLTTCHSTATNIVDDSDTRIRPQKVLRDGQLLIIVEGKTYTAFGMQVRE